MTYLDPTNKYRYVAWNQTADALGAPYQYLFKPETIKKISTRITELLKNVDPLGRNLIYPDHRIAQIMGAIYTGSSRPNIGAIYTKDVIPNSKSRNDTSFLINQTISIIVTAIKNDIGMEEANKRLKYLGLCIRRL